MHAFKRSRHIFELKSGLDELKLSTEMGLAEQLQRARRLVVFQMKFFACAGRTPTKSNRCRLTRWLGPAIQPSGDVVQEVGNPFWFHQQRLTSGGRVI